MKVNFMDLKAQNGAIRGELDEAISAVIDSCAFAGGPFVAEFEKNFASAHGAGYCCAVNSGTAALHIMMWALGLGEGDEVIVPANTFIATAEAVSLTGAVPVFADCGEDFNIDCESAEKLITAKTKAILAVHLYGRPAEMDRLKKMADENNIMLLEDCAQAHLAEYKGKSVGTFGRGGAFSFYPGKNLGSFGEGGAVVTDDKALYEKMCVLRNHGASKKYYHDTPGHNYRMAGIQGAVLNVKLKYLDGWTEKRRQNAELYRKYLSGIDEVIVPQDAAEGRHVYHLFVPRCERRDELAEFLQSREIYTGLHYPIPCHLQKAYASLGYKKGDFPLSEKYADEIISLPMFAELTENEIRYVCENIRKFYA